MLKKYECFYFTAIEHQVYTLGIKVTIISKLEKNRVY